MREELEIKQRARQHLRLKIAKMGIMADPYLLIEEEDLSREIRAIETELGIAPTPTLAERRAYRPPPRYEPTPEPEPVFKQRMAGQERTMRQADIEHQMNLLKTHRRNLAHYQQQAKAYGGVQFAPPITRHGIGEAVAEIANRKRILRDMGQAVEDLPGDE